MESIIRKVADLEADERRACEALLGHALEDSQQLIVRVLTPGRPPDPVIKEQALDDAAAISRRATAHVQAAGASPAEVEEALDEAMDHIRPPAAD